jgi:hypothetical protein
MGSQGKPKQGTVVITGKTEEGFFRKRLVYKGHLYDAPGVSGRSVNKSFSRVYHHGDKVPVSYTMLEEIDGNERMSFEIIEQ